MVIALPLSGRARVHRSERAALTLSLAHIQVAARAAFPLSGEFPAEQVEQKLVGRTQ